MPLLTYKFKCLPSIINQKKKQNYQTRNLADKTMIYYGSEWNGNKTIALNEIIISSKSHDYCHNIGIPIFFYRGQSNKQKMKYLKYSWQKLQ
jgi:hypothetical protein